MEDKRLINIYNLGAVEAVEFRRGGNAIGSDISRAQVISDFQVSRKGGGQGYLVKTVAGRPDHGTNLLLPAPEGIKIRNPVIVNHSGESVVDPVIDVIKNLSAPPGFSDDLGNQHRRGGYDKSSRFGEKLDIFREKPPTFGFDQLGQRFKPRNLRVVGDRESSSDIYDLERVPLFSGPMENIRRDPQGCRVIVKVGALASHVKA